MTQGKTGSRGREERPAGQIYRMVGSQLLETEKVTGLWQRCFPKKKDTGARGLLGHGHQGSDTIQRINYGKGSFLPPKCGVVTKGPAIANGHLEPAQRDQKVWAPCIIDKFLCLSHSCPSSWMSEPKDQPKAGVLTLPQHSPASYPEQIISRELQKHLRGSSDVRLY